MSSVYNARTAPLGIKIICILGAISGVLDFFGTLPALASPAAPIALIVLAIVVAKLAVVFGLWTLKRWAWKWTLVIYGLGTVLALFTLNVIGIIINAIVFVYVFSKEDYYR